MSGRLYCQISHSRKRTRHDSSAPNLVRPPSREGAKTHRSSDAKLSFLQLFILSSLCTTVCSEEEVYSEIEDVLSEESSPACVFAFSLIFSFFIMLFGAVVAYFSFMEDSLMRTYIKEGELMTGDVMSFEFARGGGQVGACSNKRAIAEYITFVEYTRKLSTNYEVRVRKQMKAMETDFVKPLLPGSSAMLKSLKDQVENDKIIVDRDDDNDSIDCDAYVDIGPIHQSSPLGRPDTIELYVLPDYPTSALPRRQIERAVGHRHRLATLSLLVVVLALAAFCSQIAAEALVDMNNSLQREIEFYALMFFVGLFLVQLPLVHFCLRGLFWNILESEYLASGDYVPPIQRDDSSLSTTGSDAYLLVSPCSSPTTVGLDISQSNHSVNVSA